MRRLLLIFITVISLAACKKDPEDKLKGRWDVIKQYYAISQDGKMSDQNTENYTTGKIYVVFNENTYKAYEEGALEDEGTFSANESSITLNSKTGNSQTAKLHWRSKKEIVWSFNETENVTGSNYNVKLEITLKKN